MKTNYKSIFLVLGVVSSFIILLIATSISESNELVQNETLRTSGAGKALDMWNYERAYPNEAIPLRSWEDAFILKREEESRSIREGGGWENLGPTNIGGRMLCIAFHPSDEDIMYAGSASGGLWKTTSQGAGPDAWEYVPTGFPVLGVGAIAIDQNNPDIIFIGTGETYGVGYAEPGTVNRLTRGTYGIGILRSTDGGASWSQVLTYDEDEIKGVQDIEISSQNSLEIYATTTDGLYQSLDGGNSWSLIFTELNSIDVEIDPNNGDIIYVTHGNFNYNLDPNLSGIFKSTDKGATFNELTDPGLLTAWSGTAKLSFDPTNSNTLFASIQVGWFNTQPTTPAGIFKSTDGGATWSNINNQNIAQFQGWYSHDIAINPQNTQEIINVGVQNWKSEDGGATFNQKSTNAWTLGEVPVGIPEGTNFYVHSDIHAVYYHPINNKVFYATDGGIFVSDDGDDPFTTLNEGLQTTQFYADMASPATTLDLAIAGAQDNASYIYRGNPNWWRVIGGDGMTTSINPNNPDIMYASSQGLNMLKSTDRGMSFLNITPTPVANDYPAFSAPYELTHTNYNIIYAGRTLLYKSEDAGATWGTTSNQSVDGGNVILKIAIAYDDPDHLLLATTPDPLGGFGTAPGIFRTTDGGVTFTELNGLPDRIAKDIEFDPTDSNVAYITFSGFGTDHVFKTTDGGDSWTAIDNGLPDLPTNTIAIDPLNPDDLYVGNDLGVYYSNDGGSSWSPYSESLPEATMIYDLNVVNPPNRKLRIATHGHGIWQRDFVNDPLGLNDLGVDNASLNLYPNPANDYTNIQIDLKYEAVEARLRVYDVQGRLIEEFNKVDLVNGTNTIRWNIAGTEAGLYFVQLSAGEITELARLIVR